MPRGRPKIRHCKVCGAETDPADLSLHKKCPACTARLMDENNSQLAAHNGPYFDKWRRAMAASVGGALLDDLTPRP
jgi:hypothetical protein